MNEKRLTPQQALLSCLRTQRRMAVEFVGWNPYLVIGTPGCHKAVAEALLRRGLVDRGLLDRITINAAGEKEVELFAPQR